MQKEIYQCSPGQCFRVLKYLVCSERKRQIKGDSFVMSLCLHTPTLTAKGSDLKCLACDTLSWPQGAAACGAAIAGAGLTVAGKIINSSLIRHDNLTPLLRRRPCNFGTIWLAHAVAREQWIGFRHGMRHRHHPPPGCLNMDQCGLICRS